MRLLGAVERPSLALVTKTDDTHTEQKYWQVLAALLQLLRAIDRPTLAPVTEINNTHTFTQEKYWRRYCSCLEHQVVRLLHP